LDDTMLAIARERCPGAEFAHADMTDFDLGRTFDAVVCLFSSIGYAQTIDRLGRTASAMVRHLAPGGTLIIEPWLTPESFQDGHLSMDTVDQPDLKVARIGRTQRDGRASHIHFDYLVGTPKGAEHVQELHTLGLFTDEEYRAAFAGAGVTLERLVDEGLPNRGMYAGTRPLRP
jgi:SAM-dependent methyltransferase